VPSDDGEHACDAPCRNEGRRGPCHPAGRFEYRKENQQAEFTMTGADEQALAAVTAALAKYSTEECMRAFEVESDLDFWDAMSWVVGVQSPGDIGLLLLGMKWSLEHVESRTWFIGLSHILFVIDESVEGDWREQWTQTLRTLPRDDCMAVLSWLEAVGGWPEFGEECGPAIAELVARWSAKCAAADAGGRLHCAESE